MFQLKPTSNGAAVFQTARTNTMRKYPNREDARYDDYLILPSVAPGFKIAPGSSVFTIGSCFARNVEDALLARGVKVPTARFSAAEDEIPGRPNRVLNQYNPGTMLQVVENVFGQATEGGIYKASMTKSDVVDCLLSTGGKPVTPERAEERRAQISQLYSDGLAESDTVIITLGLIETWLDRETGIYLNEAPPVRMLRFDRNHFDFEALGVTECETLISKMIELLNKDRPRNVVLTVSPVPLQVTFSGGDAVTANGYSKAVLRVVAQTVSNNFSNVDYFPSYEAVTSGGFRSVGEDNIHVRPRIVERVVDYMLDQYLEGT